MTISSKTLSVYVQYIKDHPERRQRERLSTLPYSPKLLESTISDIVNVVIRKYFYTHVDITEIYSIGYCKAVAKLSEDFVDPRYDLVNIVFSTARNEIGNYLRKIKREISLPNENFDYSLGKDVGEEMDFEALHDIETIYDEIANRFKRLGIIVCKLHSFLNRKGNLGDHGATDRKSRFAWFSVKSAIIRSVISGGD